MSQPSTAKFMLIGLLALQSGACATIVDGANQEVAIETVDAASSVAVIGANCTLSSAGIGTKEAVTPAVVRLEKSKHPVSVRCRKEGFQESTGSIGSEFSGWTLGNVLIGGLIGVAVDASSGASNKYDAKVTVKMVKLPEPPPPPPPRRRGAPPLKS